MHDPARDAAERLVNGCTAEVQRHMLEILTEKYAEPTPSPAGLRAMAAQLVALPVREATARKPGAKLICPHCGVDRFAEFCHESPCKFVAKAEHGGGSGGITSTIPPEDNRQTKVTLVFDSFNGLNRVYPESERANGKPGA